MSDLEILERALEALKADDHPSRVSLATISHMWRLDLTGVRHVLVSAEDVPELRRQLEQTADLPGHDGSMRIIEQDCIPRSLVAFDPPARLTAYLAQEIEGKQ